MKRDAKKAGPKVVTANALDTGWVVFLKADGGWSRDIREAAVADDAEAEAALNARGLEAAQHNIVVEPYLVEVRDVDGGRVPVLLREVIRAAGGPTASTLHRIAEGAVV
ncbi:MAG: DUF2849 domain-containing protein [Chelatococcus sp.]|jgi:hypothetical protein|uniref:DUF2849 domain-containing protein n=1 Tax=unclassified Chelatococcus TaxID=2638111 RepID=UPI001BCEE11F|nr:MULTISPECIES: DUF2849 domain-containing protein [unclassified Chelatococcus]CAH1660482.1 conserved hypothetical protein [Hyphomicrobiales bacterium]MBS7741116.1 DUF2849 domain-containing protein [Chelatococcus sp. HY11]MBX3539917.1 DUF2849 domain-containing protein [Chelatococcus sp.]MBX3545302.1 DUF2849 domain-containing protein [Chelatococcus sp.]MCO5077935.1 DUF2849 domain-containing protein [Chelatococcus sp.]